MRSYPIADIFIHDCNQFVVALKAVHRFRIINLLVTAFDCRKYSCKEYTKKCTSNDIGCLHYNDPDNGFQFEI